MGASESSGTVAGQVVEFAVGRLQSAGYTQEIAERTRYVRDLVVVGIASFEAGRLAALSEEERVRRCTQ
jgi:hypothetical protein